jgi:serine/threonine protein kinase
MRLCPNDGAVLEASGHTAEQLVGVVLDGKYRLDSHLSSGGMGAVFRATHAMLGKPVAVKLIKGELVTSPETARRFQREARAATSLSHPGIVAVYDLGQTDDGTLYIAMELVDGRSLKDEIRRHGRIDPARTVRLLRQVASALAVAHRQQIIHRDLKPQNVMLTRDADGQELAKLLDFGIAKTFDDAQTQLTAAGFTLGTPHYMSPEQAMGSEVDARSDIYSLGVVMYEMLTGEVPFTASSTSGILVKHMTEPPAPPSRRRPDIRIPAQLEAIALRCLEKQPDRRYHTAEDLAAALEAEAVADPSLPLASAVSFDATTRLVGGPDAGVVVPPPTVGGAGVAVTSRETSAPASVTVPGDAQTRPTVPAVHPPPEVITKPGRSLGALAAIAGVIVLIGALGAALWVLTERGRAEPEQGTAGIEPSAPDAVPVSALRAADPSVPTPEPARDASSGSTGSTPDVSDAGQPSTAATAAAVGRDGDPHPPAPVAPAAPVAPRPSATTTAAAAGSALTQPPVAVGTDAVSAVPPPPAAPAQAAAGAPAVPADPSVFVECRGAGEVCGAVRAAFDQALQREQLGIARVSDRADIVLVANVTVIDERRDQQFGQVMAVRTYSIEMLGDAPRLDRVIPMPPPRTFSFDQRFGAERANENARAVAIDAVGRIREFLKKERLFSDRRLSGPAAPPPHSPPRPGPWRHYATHRRRHHVRCRRSSR